MGAHTGTTLEYKSLTQHCVSMCTGYTFESGCNTAVQTSLIAFYSMRQDLIWLHLMINLLTATFWHSISVNRLDTDISLIDCSGLIF